MNYYEHHLGDYMQRLARIVALTLQLRSLSLARWVADYEAEEARSRDA